MSDEVKITNKEAERLMKLHGHRFGYCSNCGPMIYCGYCGNNCCNGGSGENVRDSQGRYTGKFIACKDGCNEAYLIQNCVKYPLNYLIRQWWTFRFDMWIQRYIRVTVNNFFYERGINISIGRKIK